MRGRRSPDADIDLGLAVSALSLHKGQKRTYEELAAFCGVTHRSIQKIEQRALRKLKARLKEQGFSNSLRNMEPAAA